MSETIWDVLGIAPTTDERAIKRAYAARVKVNSPERDAAGYMRLREAYEFAKAIAAMQRRGAQALEQQPAQQAEQQTQRQGTPAEPPSAVPPPAAELSMVLQRRAFEELRDLLGRGELEPFLQRVGKIKAEQTFATLDEQHDFVGVVASLVQDAEIQDIAWRGRLAAALGARDYENVFPPGTRYWHAYDELLKCYTQQRMATAQAHVEGHNDILLTPGYLHVFYVLTAPFDAERLSALTRSQSYHRVAQKILERAKTDPSIVIPPENREWWERTAMAGQHRPVAEPVAAAPAPQQGSRSIPIWPIWMVLVVLVNLGRTCSNHSSDVRLSPEDVRQLTQYTPNASSTLPEYPKELEPTVDELNPRLALCDRETRSALLMHLALTRQHDDAGPGLGARPPPAVLNESDPIVAKLLEKCRASRFFDSDGRYQQPPDSPPIIPAEQ